MKRFTLPFLLVAGLGLFAVGTVRAQEHEMLHHEMRRTVRVSGEGTARVAPDQATARFSVVTRAREPEAAREQNAEGASQAMNAVRELGIPEENMRLETLRLQPRYDYDDGERDLIGYEAVRSVVVEMDDLEQLPTLVARVVQQGANRLDGVQYGLESRTQARDEALREALTDAREKAELMAGTLDVALGQVLRISEAAYQPPRPMVRRTMAFAESSAQDAAPAPDAFAPGEIEVEATVQVVFELQ